MKKSVLDFTRSIPIENPVVINDITWISYYDCDYHCIYNYVGKIIFV